MEAVSVKSYERFVRYEDCALGFKELTKSESALVFEKKAKRVFACFTSKRRSFTIITMDIDELINLQVNFENDEFIEDLLQVNTDDIDLRDDLDNARLLEGDRNGESEHAQTVSVAHHGASHLSSSEKDSHL